MNDYVPELKEIDASYLCPTIDGIGFWRQVGGLLMTPRDRARAIDLSKRLRPCRFFKAPMLARISVSWRSASDVVPPRPIECFEFEWVLDPAFKFEERWQGPGFTEWVRLEVDDE